MSPIVLVLEDDPWTVMLIESVLGDIGCESVAVSDSDEALQLAASTKFDVIIADWSVPGKTGTADVVNELRKRNPKVRVHITTGYPREVLHGLPGDSVVLNKPVDYEQLAKQIQESS